MKILVITPIRGISEIYSRLANAFDSLDYLPDASYAELMSLSQSYDVVFTNPNRSKVYIDQTLCERLKIKIVCTASTGTAHIDQSVISSANILVISLKDQIERLSVVTSTAEHAVALTLLAARKLPSALQHVKSGGWDCEPFIGCQLSTTTVGIVGMGRLGSIYGKIMSAFGARVIFYDPYVSDEVGLENYERVNSLAALFTECNVISLHVHLNLETSKMICSEILECARNDLILVNTSRGGIVMEDDLLKHMSKPGANMIYATDVVTDEVIDLQNSAILSAYKNNTHSDRLIVTPHLGGMTHKARATAYNIAVDLLFEAINAY